MKLISINDEKIIKDFLIKASLNSGAEFLASSQWADILKNEEAVETLGIYEDDKLVAVFNSIKKDFKFGLVFYYLPRGPVFASDLSVEKTLIIWQYLISEFKKRHSVFLRVEPYNKLPDSIKTVSSINLQPKETLILDLSLAETDLLKDFHPKTRYNIKLAEKKGVIIRRTQWWSSISNSLNKQSGCKSLFSYSYSCPISNFSKIEKNFVSISEFITGNMNNSNDE